MSPDFSFLARRGRIGRLFHRAGHQLFGFAYRQALGDHLAGQADLAGRVDRQQRARVAHVDVAGHQHGLHRLGQVHQAQQVGHRAARTADRIRGLLVGKLKSSIRRWMPCASSSGLRSSRWMFSISAIAAAAWSSTSRTSTGIVLQAGQLGRAEAALAGDDLVAHRAVVLPHRPHQHRLHDALGS